MKLPDNFQFVFVTSYYDGPLHGLCTVDGVLHEFDVDYDSDEITVFELSKIQKFKWLTRKFLFEICIGRHHSYKDGKSVSGVNNYPNWLKEILFRLYYLKYYRHLKWRSKNE